MEILSFLHEEYSTAELDNFIEKLFFLTLKGLIVSSATCFQILGCYLTQEEQSQTWGGIIFLNPKHNKPVFLSHWIFL